MAQKPIVYTVYKTVNLVNSKYYIGVHKTSDPQDDYLGSGKLLNRAIRKYGVGNFRKEVLFVFDTDKAAFTKEFELIEAAKADKLCYNLRQGGSGGFDYINRNGLHNVVPARKAFDKKAKEDPSFLSSIAKKRMERHGDKLRAIAKQNFAPYQALGAQRWKGRHHTNDTLHRLSDSHRGNKNQWFGTVWMRDPQSDLSERVSTNEIEIRKASGWVLGRDEKRLLECLFCKKIFAPHTAHQKCCSKRCGMRSHSPIIPPKEELLSVLSECDFRSAGVKYGVTHRTVMDWAKMYEFTRTRKGQIIQV